MNVTAGDILREEFSPEPEVAEESVVAETEDALIESEQDEGSEQLEEEEQVDDDAPIQTITQLAETLEIDPSEFYSLQVPLADGMEPLSLGEIKDRYQEYASKKDELEQGQIAFQAERDALLNEVTQLKTQAVSQGTQTSKEMIEAQGLLQAIQAQYESIDWDAAEKENPAEAVLYKQKLNDAYGGAKMQLQNVMQQTQVQQQASMKQYYTQQWGQTLERIPEWKDKETYISDRAALESVAMDYGFSPDETKQIADARTVKLLHDYAKLKAELAGANANAKEVERKSFGLKPSGLRSRKLKRESDLQKITERAKKTGNRDDQRAAVAAILSNSR